MPAQLTNDRPSLKITLTDRYKNQNCGGAYNAKEIISAVGSRSPIYSSDGNSTCLSSRQWTKPNFAVKMLGGQSEYNDVDNKGMSSNELSIYIRGFKNRKYKP